METIDVQKIHEKLAYLTLVRKELLTKELSPEGAWLHQYTVRRTYPSGYTGVYKYVKWQANHAIFKRNPKKRALPLKPGKNARFTTHQHIGCTDSDEAREAYETWNNRLKLEAIERALSEIEAILSTF
ncbi:hypothetical protein NIES2101_37450 [Calothrix sp. HK-06]|nr:hypothetical protein NIES2101_37450 [Calothrix sp. HK-06]